MTERLLQLATEEKMHRISLTVVKENTIALALYKKFGFQIEGISKDAFYDCDGKYHDVVNMGLILH
jgi:RimJ/RimL family protein N-acetyltransferase